MVMSSLQDCGLLGPPDDVSNLFYKINDSDSLIVLGVLLQLA